MTAPHEIGFASRPRRVARPLFLQGERPLADVDHQAERTLPECLREGAGAGHHDVGSGRPEAPFEKALHPRLVVGERDQPGDLRRQRHDVQGAGSGGDTESGEVGSDAEQVPLDRFAVRRVVRPIVWEAFVRDVVDVLHRLDGLDQVGGLDRFGIEDDDQSSDDRVDLGPMNSVECLDGLLHVGTKRVTLGCVRSSDLDVCAAVGDVDSALHPSLGVAERTQPGAHDPERVNSRRRPASNRGHGPTSVPGRSRPRHRPMWAMCAPPVPVSSS